MPRTRPLRSEKSLIAGTAGAIEVAQYVPYADPPRAVAVVAHPHPLFGGSMDNKVVTTIAGAFHDLGAATTRFNFRGVGQSQGSHAEGRGESEDMLKVIEHARAKHPDLPLWLAGFSFGGAVALAASEQQRAAEMVLVAPALARLAQWNELVSGGRPPAGTLLIHGDNDQTVPLADSLAWARMREIAVVLVPGADHFFHQRLQILRALVMRQIRGAQDST